MNRWKKHVPEGVQDYLPQECYNKRSVEAALRDYFLRCGYDEVQTPAFEYFDVFASGVGGVDQEKMLKFFDDQGRILALRPDLTVPMARVAGTKLKSNALPLRLSYIGESFGNSFSHNGHTREWAQAGMELIGVSGAQGDAEAIAMAIGALRESGLKRFQIDIGQVEFFKGLMEESGLGQEASERLRVLVDQKDMLSIELMLRETDVSSELTAKVQRLAELYGGPEVLDEAQALSGSARCRAALGNLRDIYGLLRSFGLAEYISFDLGMVYSIHYYSGAIFRGITEHLGVPILSGGRYDGLMADFDRPAPATGFALGIKRTLIALEREGALKDAPAAQAIVGSAAGFEGAAWRELEALRAQGIRSVAMLGCTLEQVRAHARERRASRALYIDAAGARELAIGEG